MADSKSIYLLLGSNLGNRLAVLETAVKLIAERVGNVSEESAVYETAPWGITDQPTFLNQVIRVESELTPENALEFTLSIEQELGRVRGERWGARVIDIDLLFYDDLILDTPSLILPHPRLHERRFTLIPLAEIAADHVHPLLKKTVLDLLNNCPDNGVVSKFHEKNTI